MDAHTVFSPLVERATELAAEWHAGTHRKGRWRSPIFTRPGDAEVRVPTMAHLTTVALTVQRAGWPDEAVAAAFLHDALEDANAENDRLDRTRLREAVGEAVTRLVAAVTEKRVDEDGHFRPWQDRKDDYVAQLRREPPAAVAISLADKLHNLWTMNQTLEAGDDPFATRANRTGLSAGPERQRWFHRAVLDASRTADDDRLVPLRERLAAEIDRFERLTGLA